MSLLSRVQAWCQRTSVPLVRIHSTIPPSQLSNLKQPSNTCSKTRLPALVEYILQWLKHVQPNSLYLIIKLFNAIPHSGHFPDTESAIIVLAGKLEAEPKLSKLISFHLLHKCIGWNFWKGDRWMIDFVSRNGTKSQLRRSLAFWISGI